MDLTQLNLALDNVFAEDNARIVFWNDPEQEFAGVISDLKLSDVNVLRLDEIGALEAKIRLEREDIDGRYLLYSPAEEPDFDSDWLLDIRLYSRSFRADRASIILDELGLAHQTMREHISRRRKFFDSKERIRKLKPLVSPDDNASLLDQKMLAVVSKADSAELFTIVRTLYQAVSQADPVDLDEPPFVWVQIEKFELDASFWELVKGVFGYEEKSPNLRNLLIRLFVADYVQHLDAEPPGTLQSLLLPRSGAANAVVCLAQWRDSASSGQSYNLLADEVAARIHLDSCLAGNEVESLLDVMTFFEVEKCIVRGLLERVAATSETVASDSIRKIASRRQAGHWVASSSIGEAKRKARHAVYEAAALAAELFALRHRYPSGFQFDSAAKMYAAYESELYRFDQLYRHFCVNADIAQAQSWHMLKPLRAEVEAVYCNWYLTQLGMEWGRHIESGMLNNWQLDGVDNQQRFFSSNIQPHLAQADNRRAYVIISDAFRYEVAEELTRSLNSTYRFQAELGSQLGVLPSYTTLGMASLLPHASLEYKYDGGVMVDGKPTSSTKQRDEILKSVEGMAIKAGDLTALTKEEGRERVGDARVVYIYHNEIDARGDTASTESGTFDAARKAIEEVADTVRYVVNNLNGSYVLVTADHGFLFRERQPDETDKSQIADKPAGTVIAKKRYLLGKNLGEHDSAWHGRTSDTANAKGDMEFLVPKAANRFHFTGGARFVHGGAMPQEIVVPIVRVKHVRGATSKKKTRTKQVDVQVIGGPHKITTPKHRFRLMQLEPVSDRVKPARLKVAIYEGDEPVTSIETATFDCATGNLEDREKYVTLTLQDREYDKRAGYRLILRDADTDIEQQSVDVIIDRAIADDFDF